VLVDRPIVEIHVINANSVKKLTFRKNIVREVQEEMSLTRKALTWNNLEALCKASVSAADFIQGALMHYCSTLRDFPFNSISLDFCSVVLFFLIDFLVRCGMCAFACVPVRVRLPDD